MQPVSFQRMYGVGDGPVYPATPKVVETLLASMNADADGEWPFKVRFRLPDGSTVIAAPKRGR